MSRNNLENRLMRRLVDGVAAWATFHQAGHPVAHYDEHLFYTPIREIAEARGWVARQQEKLIRAAGAKGAPKSVDFIIFRKNRAMIPQNLPLLFVEVKYLRGANPSQDIAYLADDIEKLRNLSQVDLECASTLARCKTPTKFLLILARNHEWDAILACNSKKNVGVAAMLRQARSLKQASVYRSKISTYLKAEYQWQAMAIGSRRWPG